MSSNTFGKIFTITTWGESHGPAIGVVIDGCPAGVEINEEKLHIALRYRRPGNNSFTSTRAEEDYPQILSGVFNGKTTGTPLSICIRNHDADSSKYESFKNMLRPGHANYTYLEKYRLFDYRGGGRASARETACRVAAGAVAKQILDTYDIDIVAYVKQIGHLTAHIPDIPLKNLRDRVYESPIHCPDRNETERMIELIKTMQDTGDSIGGRVEFRIEGIPPGLGDPIYDKLDARLAYAMMSIPASKGFEIGAGCNSANMKGSEYTDSFIYENQKVTTSTNNSGGILGGISVGTPIVGQVAFKPTASIMKAQETVTIQGEAAVLTLPPGSRHDPCIAIRAAPVVEAMAALVVVDSLLLQRSSKL